MLGLLRGEEIDWARIEEKHTPKRLCLVCGFVRVKDSFLPSQWNRKDERCFCKACVAQKMEEEIPYECLTCHFWKAGGAFSDQQQRSYAHRRCMDCVEKRKCKDCEQLLPETKFTHHEWIMAPRAKGQGRCKDCMQRSKETKSCCRCDNLFDVDGFAELQWRKNSATRVCKKCVQPKLPRGSWRCVECKDVKAKAEFSRWQSKRQNKQNDGKARCNACSERQQKVQLDMLRESVSQIVQSEMPPAP